MVTAHQVRHLQPQGHRTRHDLRGRRPAQRARRQQHIIRQQLGRMAVKHHPAIRKRDDPRRVLRHQVQVVRHHHRGRARRYPLGHAAHQAPAMAIVLPESRFVEHDHVRVSDQGTCNRQPTLLPVGKREWVGVCQVVKVSRLHGRCHARRPLNGGQAFDLHRRLEICAYGISHELVFGVLEHVPEPAPPFGQGHRVQDPTIERQRPLGRRLCPRHHQAKGALPCAVPSDHRHQFASVKVKVDARNRVTRRAWIAKPDTPHRQAWHRSWCPLFWAVRRQRFHRLPLPSAGA